MYVCIISNCQIQRASCKRAIQRFPKLLTDQFIDKSSITKIGQYDDIKACRKSARLLRKQCHTLGQCCPLDRYRYFLQFNATFNLYGNVKEDLDFRSKNYDIFF